MRLPRSLLKHKVFLGNVATLMSARAVAAAIALLTMPIVARLFTAEDFGVAAMFLSLGVMLSNVGALRYEAALVLPKSDSEALLLMSFSYRALGVICLLLLVCIGGYKLSSLTVPVLESLGMWLWFVPLGVLLLTALQIQESWLGRKKQFKLVATAFVAGTAVVGGSRISFGLLSGSSTYGLIIGQLLGQMSRLVMQKSATVIGIKVAFRHVSWQEMRDIAAKYSDFPKLNAPAAFLTAAAQQLPVMLFGVLFSPAIVGFYAMAIRLTQVPILVVANSVRRVFLQKAADINNRGRSLEFAFLMATGGLALLGIIPLLVLWFFGETITVLLLGEKWAGTGRYLEIMSPWLFTLWASVPANPIFIVLRKQRLWLTMQVTATTVRLATFGLSYILKASPELTLGAFVTATVMGNVFVILAAWFLIRRHQPSLAAA